MSSKQANQEQTRRNKRRHNLENKVSKIYQNFINDRDIYYQERLTNLQTKLTTLHQGNNEQFVRDYDDHEETRDLELVRLRLYEEYRISRSRIEFQEDMEKIKEVHEKLIKLCKEKLYESIERKIKKLQEERLLMDVANAHSYSMDYGRIKYQQKNTRSHTTSAWESSGAEFTNNGGRSRDSANESNTDTGSLGLGMENRRGLRRRRKNQDDIFENTNEEGNSSMNNGISAKSSLNNGKGAKRSNGYTSGDNKSDAELMQSLNDNPDLQMLLFGATTNTGKDGKKRGGRGNQRYSAKSAPPLKSLAQEEVTDDILLIRNLTGQPPAPFRN